MIGQALLINRLTIEASSDENEEITASQTSEDDFARRMKQIEALSRLYIIAIQKGRLIEQADLVARFELATRQAKDLYPGKVEDIACLAPKGPPTGTSLASSAGWVADMTPAERHGLGDGE